MRCLTIAPKKWDGTTVGCPTLTRVERHAGHCRCCGATTRAAVPEGLKPGTPFSLNIVALAMYLRFVHAVDHGPCRLEADG